MSFKMATDILLTQLSLLLLYSGLIFKKSHRPVTVSGNKTKSGSHCETFAFGVHFAPLSFSIFYLFKMTFTILLTQKTLPYIIVLRYLPVAIRLQIHSLHCRFNMITFFHFNGDCDFNIFYIDVINICWYSVHLTAEQIY